MEAVASSFLFAEWNPYHPGDPGRPAQVFHPLMEDGRDLGQATGQTNHEKLEIWKHVESLETASIKHPFATAEESFQD